MSGKAIVVIDMQVALMKGAYREAETLEAVNRVIDGARAEGVPVVFVQHNHAAYDPLKKGAPGWAIHSSLHKTAADEVVEKTASDAFFETRLESVLSGADVSEIVVGGLQTEYCVDATCRAALSRGFDVTLIADGHTTGNAHLPAEDIIAHHNLTLANLAHPTSSVTVTPAHEINFGRGGPPASGGVS